MPEVDVSEYSEVSEVCEVYHDPDFGIITPMTHWVHLKTVTAFME